MHHKALSSSIFALSLVACSSEPPSVVLRTDTDKFGLITCSEASEERTCITHRAVIGVSMGSLGAGQLGLMRPELFDSIGMLGVPMVDWVYMLKNIKLGYLGGFCDRETILANLDRINDPTGPAFCGPYQGTEMLAPGIAEPPQDFNHWYRWIEAGRGGTFGRNKLRESFQDISLAFGNALYYNPESPYYPPHVPLEFRDITSGTGSRPTIGWTSTADTKTRFPVISSTEGMSTYGNWNEPRLLA